MRKSYVALLLLVGAVAFSAGLAFAQEENGQIVGAKLMNARMSQELLSRAAKLGVSSTPTPNDTVYVGYNAAFAGSNYWSVGKGHPLLPYNQMGMWTWEYRVHGDSLQGWWPIRALHTNASGATRVDVNRPWWAIEEGNQANYVIEQDAAHKRTFGVVGVWHSDAGSLAGGGVGWTPDGGAGKSAWMGLRAHGDVASGLDPITGNPWNSTVMEYTAVNGATTGGSIGTSRNFPGYGSQMDQMLYKDIDVSGMPADSGLAVVWRWRSTMSTLAGTTAATRTGWFEGDPIKTPTVGDGNFISADNPPGTLNPSEPVDSFEVYVGAPAETTIAGKDNFLASDGTFHPIYDSLRRWFNEVLWKGRRLWVFGSAGTSGTGATWNSASAVLTAGQKSLLARNGKIRLVYRVHTNRGFDDEGTTFTSNGEGAAQLDNVKIGASIDPVNATTVIGDFEGSDVTKDIDNTNPLSWHSTGKPPATYFHAHALASLPYADLCGPPGNPFRICDMDGIVISAGDHDFFEAAGGALGTSEEEGNWGMMSPTINLVAASKTPNSMGITGEEASPTEDYYISYEIYTGIFDIFSTGNAWQFGFQSYPAKQRNGKFAWGEYRLPGFLYFNPDVQCFKNLDAARANGLIVTANGSGVPDSLRLHLRKLQQCYRFGVTTGCSPTDGAYFDNVALVIIDGKPQPMSVDIWQWIQDTFPVNENPGLPGTSAFDTTTALVRTGINVAQTTGNKTRYDVPGDSIAIVAAAPDIRIDVVFRVLPGPGNYRTIGNRTSGLRTVPTSSAGPVTPGDGSWFGTYMSIPGTWSSPGAAAQHAAAPSGWSELVWNSAQCDTADFNAFPVAARGFNNNIDPTIWMTCYHESDPHGGLGAPLAISRPKCFLIDTLGLLTEPNIICSGVAPGWVTTVPTSRTGYDGNAFTTEGTSIFPDGIFTPGTHVEYFIRRNDGPTMPIPGQFTLCPDTTVVSPQPLESSTDAHRWQEFSVLPDRWKDGAYGGPGTACMLYVDWNDRRGAEAVWVGIADSIGATNSASRGNNNGWTAPGTGVDVNLPAYRVYKNKQAGTTWDMYGVKASESLTTSCGQLGSRLQYTDPAASNKVNGKYARQGPTKAMLTAYYKLVMIESGDLNSGILGQFNDRSQNDIKFLEDYLLTATTTVPVGLWCGGDGFLESEDFHDAAGGFTGVNSLTINYMGAFLKVPGYRAFSGNPKQVADLVYNGTTAGVGDIYGVRNQCTYTLDVIDGTGLPEIVSAANYENYGINGPYMASAYKPANATRPWISVLDGFNIFNVRSRFGIGSYGRLAYYYNSFANWFSPICTITGLPVVTLDTPGLGNGSQFVDFMNLRNNPLRSGVATVNFGLAKSDRVEIKVYDVTGRLVRTLADRVFAAGEHKVEWDGVNDHGQLQARGVYFTQVKYQNSRFVEAKKLTLLK